MGIVNKRNAFLGWAAWKVGKRVLKRKAQAVVPGVDASSGRGKGLGAVAALAAAVGGALFFWRRGRGDDDVTPSSPN